MRVEIGSDVYSVSWQHRVPRSPTVPNDKVTTKNPGTTCIVEKLSFELGTWVTHAQSEVKLHYKDKFDKETGRRKSLTKVLTPLSREERTLFWEAYWTR